MVARRGGYGSLLWLECPPLSSPSPVCTLICFLTVLFPPALILINILMVLGLGLGLSASERLVLEGVFIPCSCLT